MTTDCGECQRVIAQGGFMCSECAEMEARMAATKRRAEQDRELTEKYWQDKGMPNPRNADAREVIAEADGPVKCHDCAELALPGQRRCAKHAEAVRQRSRERRAALKAKGMCDACGRQPATHGIKCAGCAENARQVTKGYTNSLSHQSTLDRRDAAGQCLGCGGERDGPQKRCSQCRARVNAKQRKEAS